MSIPRRGERSSSSRPPRPPAAIIHVLERDGASVHVALESRYMQGTLVWDGWLDVPDPTPRQWLDAEHALREHRVSRRDVLAAARATVARSTTTEVQHRDERGP